MNSSLEECKQPADYVKKGFHLKFIVKLFFLFTLSGIISGTALYLVTNSDMGISYSADHITLINTWKIILPTLIFSTFITMIIVGTAIVYITLRASHKLAGPIFKFEMIVKEVASGNLSIHTSLRFDDELKMFSDEMTKMVAELKNKIIILKSSIEVIMNIAETSSEEELSKNKRFYETVCEFKKDLDYFKIYNI